MQIKVTITAGDSKIFILPVDEDESVENLKSLVQIETAVPVNQQQLLLYGVTMNDGDSLKKIGVVNGDLIAMTSKRVVSRTANSLSMNPDGSAVNPAAFQQHLQQDSKIASQLFETDPELAQVIFGNDLNKMQEILRARTAQISKLRLQKENELALYYADPFDVAAQKKIEESIRQKGVDENWESALEHNPESFTNVVMLYVDMEVNGVALKAFVDSGAQTTIISKSCADRCGLLRLLDVRYKGVAHGVGQTEIIGRIHVAPIKIGNMYYPCSFTVLDTHNMEFLFGLDMLRKHQCIIDLKDNLLRVGGGEVAIPFLHEKDIPFGVVGGKHPSETPETHLQVQPQLETRNSSGHKSTASSSHESNKREIEGKISKLVELGFQRNSVVEALSLFGGNEEQAAAFLFSS